jgi:hypothetical protein
MARREELLVYLWKDVINLNLRAASLDNIISHCKRNPAAPFGDTGPAIERILAAGAFRQDLCMVLRASAYEAVFGTLYEELLMADPSGMEGRPGSADAARSSSQG